MKMQDLPPDRMEELINRYYAGERVAELIRAFDLDMKPNQIVSAFPPERTERKCRQCGGTIVRPRRARGNSWSSTSAEHCEICRHFESDARSYRRCGCPACRDEKMRATEARRKQIDTVISRTITSALNPDLATWSELDTHRSVESGQLSGQIWIRSDPACFQSDDATPALGYSRGNLREAKVNFVAGDTELAVIRHRGCECCRKRNLSQHPLVISTAPIDRLNEATHGKD